MWYLKNEISFDDKSLENKLKTFVSTLLPENNFSAWVDFFDQHVFSFQNLLGVKPISILFIEGNIGAGKTTLLDFFKKQSKQIKLIDEPLFIWESIINVETGKNVLELFYDSLKIGDALFVLKFELVALFTRVIMFMDAISRVNQDETKLLISERSIFTDRYF